MPTIKKQDAKKPSKAVGNVVSRIKQLTLEDDGIKIVIYGRSGSGKTTLWATFPKKILAVVCSGAQETRSVHNVPGIDMVRINDEEELKILVEHQRETGKYSTIVLDHASGYQDLVLKKVLNLDEAPAQLSWGTATQEQWGFVGSGMKERLRDLLSLSCNVVIAVQEREFESKESEILSPNIGGAVSPSVWGWLAPACDYVAQTFIRQVTIREKKKVGGKDMMVPKDVIQFCLRTGPHPVYNTKFRVPKGSPLPQLIVNPSYNDIAALIEGKGPTAK